MANTGISVRLGTLTGHQSKRFINAKNSPRVDMQLALSCYGPHLEGTRFRSHVLAVVAIVDTLADLPCIGNITLRLDSAKATPWHSRVYISGDVTFYEKRSEAKLMGFIGLISDTMRFIELKYPGFAFTCIYDMKLPS